MKKTTEANLTSIPLEKIRSPQFGKPEFLSEFHTRNFRVFSTDSTPPLNHKENRSSFNETRVLKCGLLASIPPDSVDLGFPFVDVSMIQTPKLDMWKPER